MSYSRFRAQSPRLTQREYGVAWLDCTDPHHGGITDNRLRDISRLSFVRYNASVFGAPNISTLYREDNEHLRQWTKQNRIIFILGECILKHCCERRIVVLKTG
jgi:hypothetical protein